MREITKEKLDRRIDHLVEVLADVLKDRGDPIPLIALYHTIRDMQPGLCEAIAEVSGDNRWYSEYSEPMLSDREMHKIGRFLWPEEMEHGSGGG